MAVGVGLVVLVAAVEGGVPEGKGVGADLGAAEIRDVPDLRDVEMAPAAAAGGEGLGAHGAGAGGAVCPVEFWACGLGGPAAGRCVEASRFCGGCHNNGAGAAMWRDGAKKEGAAMVEAYLRVLDLEFFEVTEAFCGLADENVWKRPAEALLSVGELAGHIAFWLASRLAGEGKDGTWRPDTEKCRVSSPLIDSRFAYYPGTLAAEPSEEHRAMTAEQVCAELLRVHRETVAAFRALNPDPDSLAPGWGEPPERTYGDFLRYSIFHVAYHTGQMYSARHLLGEETPDN